MWPPIRVWSSDYSWARGAGDLLAGVTVGVMVIPQSLAYAQIAGLPHQYGLFSSYVSLLVYCVLGSSLVTSVGPTSIVCLVIASVGHPNADHDTPVANAIFLALCSGAVQVLLGVLRLGFVVRLISYPVIQGFTSAAAIVIAGGQLKHLLGIPHVRRAFHLMVEDIINHIGSTHKNDAALGCSCIVVLVCLQQLKERWWPDTRISWVLGTGRNALVAVAATLLAYFMGGSPSPFTLIGELPSGLPTPRLPELHMYRELWGGAIAVALIGFLENTAISKAFAREADYTPEPSHELVALGSCNVIGSFLQAFPVTGSFSRTTVTAKSGGSTPAAQLPTALIVVCALVFMMPAFRYIPNATLAAIIICAVMLMVDHRPPVTFWRAGDWSAFASWAVAFVGTLFLGIEYGVVGGVALDVGAFLWRATVPRVSCEHVTVDGHKGVLVVRVVQQGELGFAAADNVSEVVLGALKSSHRGKSVARRQPAAEDGQLTDVALLGDDDDDVVGVLLELDSVNRLDATSVHALKVLCAQLAARGLTLGISGLDDSQADVLVQTYRVREVHIVANAEHLCAYIDL